MRKCPICSVGENSKERGGSQNCFHCDTCGFVECECFYPDAENPIEDILYMIRSRLILFTKDKHNNI